jgi:soluble lytic murein transglycosylase
MKISPPILFNSRSVPKKSVKKAGLVVSVGLCALALGLWAGTKSGGLFFQNSQTQFPSGVQRLALEPATKRARQLEAIARGEPSLERSRARYLLAADSIEQKQGKKAIEWLKGLEESYPAMAPYIALKRYQAYEINREREKAGETLQYILKTYPKSPVAAEAFYVLGKKEPKFWQQAIAQFPSHPRTLEIIRQSLQENPDRPELLWLLIKYAPNSPGIVSLIDRVAAQRAGEFQPENWQAIGQIYWQNQIYDRAVAAYERSPSTPERAYRIARGLELTDKKPAANTAYRVLIDGFPKSEEAAIGLGRFLKILEPTEALTYLDQAIAKYPDLADEALLAKGKILENSPQPQLAEPAYQLLLKQYSRSEAAAEYRWRLAQKRAAAGDFQGAWEWAKQITEQNPQGKYGPRAKFWLGKWAGQLGRPNEAQVAFKQTLARYPWSYYAWRSAVHLGWNVGDFNTVRQLNPQIAVPSERSPLTAGSATLKELYQIGQDRDVWNLWQAEFTNRQQPTVAEQFTDALVRLGSGRYKSGIDLVAQLEDRESPQEQSEYRKLSQQMDYWYALYPLPYLNTIQEWSQKRQLNPLLVMGLIRQESRFERGIKSIANAIGLMQLIPSTAAGEAKKLNLGKYALDNPSDNIQLGTSYLAHTHELHKDNSMLAVASYNAGPGNVAKWLRTKGAIDPDEFVETIPFDETQWYVKNVFGNYWNYLRLYDREVFLQLAKLEKN